VLELEKRAAQGNETFARAGQAAGEREKIHSQHDLTLRGSSAGFNINFQQNSYGRWIILFPETIGAMGRAVQQ
jgi:hypothetical protein